MMQIKTAWGYTVLFSCSLNFLGFQKTFRDVDTLYRVTRATSISSVVGSFQKFICLTFLSLVTHISILRNVKI